MVATLAIRQRRRPAPAPASGFERESLLLAGSARPRGAMDRVRNCRRIAASLVVLFRGMCPRPRHHTDNDTLVLCDHVYGLRFSSGSEVVGRDGSFTTP